MREENKNGKETIIQLDNVKKMYEAGEVGFWALKGINLAIQKGELTAIIGKSGSGKSTLLNMLGGIDTPTEGNILIRNNVINQMRTPELTRFRGENIGFVFQFFQLMPTLTVLENILMPMDFVKKIPKSKRKERANELLEKMKMSDHRNKLPTSLSGGEQQRVAIARALANDLDIIFADEPTGNLDSRTSEEIFGVLKSLVAENKNVIMVTHNNELANRCDCVIQIADGQILSQEVLYENQL